MYSEARMMLIHTLMGQNLFILRVFLGSGSGEYRGLDMRGGKFYNSYLHLHSKDKWSWNDNVCVLGRCDVAAKSPTVICSCALLKCCFFCCWYSLHIGTLLPTFLSWAWTQPLGQDMGRVTVHMRLGSVVLQPHEQTLPITWASGRVHTHSNLQWLK